VFSSSEVSHVAGRVGSEDIPNGVLFLRLSCPPERHPAPVTSCGSIGALLPADAGNFVQIGVSTTPGMNRIDSDSIAFCRTLHRDSLCEQPHATFVAQ